MDTTAFCKNGLFLMLALDHLGSFRRLINPQNPNKVSDYKITNLKRRIIESLIDQFSGILLDFEYGLPAYQQARGGWDLQEKPPFLLRLAASGYGGDERNRYTRVEHRAIEIQEAGAAGAKLLLYFNPWAKSAAAQLATGWRVLADIHSRNLPFFLELVTYNAGDAKESNRTKAEIILRSLGMFLERGIAPDVWKLEYPGDAHSCREVTRLVGDTPWVLLTHGTSYEVFRKNLRLAVQNGARGFLAGRALWQELGVLPPAGKETFLKEILPRRFSELTTLALKCAS